MSSMFSKTLFTVSTMIAMSSSIAMDAFAQSSAEIEEFFASKVTEYNHILEQNLDGYKIDWQIDSSSFAEFSDHKKISVSVGRNVLDAIAGYAIGRDELTDFYKENLQKVIFARNSDSKVKIEYKINDKALVLSSDYDDVINQKPIWDYIYQNMCVDGVCVYEFFYLETIAKHREEFNKELSAKYGSSFNWDIDHASFRNHAPHNLLPAFGTSMREVLSAFTRHPASEQWDAISKRINRVYFVQKEDVTPMFSLTEDSLVLTSDFRTAQPKQGDIWEYLLVNVVNATPITNASAKTENE